MPASTISPGQEPTAEEVAHKAGDVQEAYLDHRNRLLQAIDNTKVILSDLQGFNKELWVIRYPRFSDAENPAERAAAPSMRRPASDRRSMSFADDPLHQTEVVLNPRKGLARAHTLGSTCLSQGMVHESAEETAAEDDDAELLIPASASDDFHVLRLDLKLGSHSPVSSPTSLVTQLEKASIANLIDERIAASLNHVDKIRARVEDTSSKVLVTGDLNAGKSTLVNALLNRDTMPVDQQPCTTAFCEVHDARDNGGNEEVHLIRGGHTYSINDETTFTRAKLVDLEQIISENEDEQLVAKVYINDARDEATSLLNNGIANISLIDAPGLNRDSLKTTALFARQEEIDVIVFVVSAENHFTLSAKEFLLNASNDKAYVFIVVNKYEQIRDKAKCRRLVLEQIKQLSPRTYEDSNDLVHFVDSASALNVDAKNPAFAALEAALRSFVLVKRLKSKLHPASNYLTHLLSDIDLLAGSNAIVAQNELECARDDLGKARPVLEKMKGDKEGLEEELDHIEERTVDCASGRAKALLTAALDKVGRGELAITPNMTVELPSFSGVINIWSYVRDVRRALLTSLDMSMKLAEDEARMTTSRGVGDVMTLSDRYLPEGVERSKRTFIPEAMFSRRVANSKSPTSLKRRSPTTVNGLAGGMYGLGVGLANRPELLETSFFDLFDVPHHFSVHFGNPKLMDAAHAWDNEDDSSPSALSVLSLSLGALTMVGGKTLGVRGIMEGVVRFVELFGNEGTRRWIAPVFGAVVIGATAYFVVDLPRQIPKTVGRRIKATLLAPAPTSIPPAPSPLSLSRSSSYTSLSSPLTPNSLSKQHQSGSVGDSEDYTSFVEGNALRIGKETRKVMRIAGWDVREKFRNAMEESAVEVRKAEDLEKRARKAVEYLGDVRRRTGEVRESAGKVIGH